MHFIYELLENKIINCIVLYCINGLVIVSQCTATFLRSIVLPEFRY